MSGIDLFPDAAKPRPFPCVHLPPWGNDPPSSEEAFYPVLCSTLLITYTVRLHDLPRRFVRCARLTPANSCKCLHRKYIFPFPFVFPISTYRTYLSSSTLPNASGTRISTCTPAVSESSFPSTSTRYAVLTTALGGIRSGSVSP
jgi:hypothetical protein